VARSVNPKLVQLWKARLDQFNRSQLTVHQFCQSLRCSTTSFYLWKRKLQDAAVSVDGKAGVNTTQASSDGGFIPVMVRQDVAGVIKIELAGGTTIHLPVQAIEALRLVLDTDGIAIWMKRLERGSLQHPQPANDAKHLIIDNTQLNLLLTGIAADRGCRSWGHPSS